MDNKEFNKLFELWKKEKMERAKDAAPAKGKDCLFFTELEAYVKDGCEALTGAQKQHIQSCAYCQKMITDFERVTQEEKQAIPILYGGLAQALENFINALAFPFKTLPRLAPALVPVLAVILVFIIVSNQPLELKNYSFEFAQPDITTRGTRGISEKRFKIRLAASHNCYVYLFSIERDKANLLLQEKVTGKVENALPKERWLQGEGKLILLLAKKPLKDTSSAGEIIAKNYAKGEKETMGILRKELKRKDISFYTIKSP